MNDDKKDLSIAPLESWIEAKKGGVLISGPCSAETREQTVKTCVQLAETGYVSALRAGIWKPRTRPGNFEGIGSEGLSWLQEAKKITGLPITTEVANAKHVYEAMRHGLDILWIGARTTVNPFAVQEVADALKGVDIPVIVKNPINPDLGLWMGAFERLEKAGISKLAGLHRGFSYHGKSKFRNEPRWQIPIELKTRVPELPILCDPSHICGTRSLLQEVAQEAMDLNYDGLMLESHIDPTNAWSDAKQQVTPEDLAVLMSKIIHRNPSDVEQVDSRDIVALRKMINGIDDELLRLLSDRMKIAEEIGSVKKANNVTILQPARWNAILDRNINFGMENGLSKEFIHKFLKAIHQESINHQIKIMNNE